MMVIMKMANQMEEGIKIIYFLRVLDSGLTRKRVMTAVDVYVIAIQTLSFN